MSTANEHTTAELTHLQRTNIQCKLQEIAGRNCGRSGEIHYEMSGYSRATIFAHPPKKAPPRSAFAHQPSLSLRSSRPSRCDIPRPSDAR